MKIARVGLGLAAAALALSACGQPQAGSAVVWTDGRITDNELAATTDALTAELEIPDSPEVTQFTVTRLAQNVLFQEAADKAGVTVSQGDVDRTTADLVAQFGDEAALKDFLGQNGLTRAELEEQVRISLLAEATLKKIDPTADPQAGGSQLFTEYLTGVSEEIELQTNPRFGVWDPTRLAAVPSTNDLSRPPDNDQAATGTEITPAQ